MVFFPLQLMITPSFEKLRPKPCRHPWLFSFCTAYIQHVKRFIWFYFQRKWKVKVKSLSCVWLFATPWTATFQAPPSMGFSREEYWSGLPFPSPGDLPDPGIEPGSPTSQADSLPPEPPGKPSQHSLYFQSGFQRWPLLIIFSATTFVWASLHFEEA